MATIGFRTTEQAAELLNPLKHFSAAAQRVQLRTDPLLGHSAVYNPLIEEGVKTFIGAVDHPLVERLKDDSASGCIFCPEKIEAVARFVPALVPEGRIRVGEAVLFPNLLALAPHHAVAVVSRAHFLELSEFTPDLIGNALLGVRQYVAAVFAQDAAARHVSVNANYLFPAGASLMHPHFQVLVSHEPYTHVARLLQACSDYCAAHGANYHNDLIDTERARGERYIGATGAWHWLAAYAPLASNEILAVHESRGDFAALTDADIAELARGMSATLRCYESLNYLSFNFTLYARRDGAEDDGFNCLLRCMTRQNPYPNYRTDDFFLQKGLQTELIVTLPETLAQRSREVLAAR